jgi:site-specific recombinase XerD
LDRIGSARQTLRSYATAGGQYWEFLLQERLDWLRITLDDLSRFVLWLKLPSGMLKVVPAHPVEQARSNRTINHALTVVRGFYDYHWRMKEVSTNLKDQTTTSLPGRFRRYKGFFHHITKGSPIAKNILRQKEEKRQRPKTITKDQVQDLLNACANERDRLLVRLLYETAMRVGESLALFVEDIDVAENCQYQIKDEQGRLFHFKSHAFRHTKAVALLNQGMSLVLVQQWLAHASPEMALIYAKILDETMRTQWEKTVQQGIVRFTDGKPEFVPGKKLLPMAGENTFDSERVREHRQNVKMALGSCLKTAKIVCKFVELPCFHCSAYVLTPDDLSALEAYEQQILERIEIGKQAGNAHWTEVSQKNLDERVRPAIALLKQGQIVAKTDKYEREYTDEEWEQRQQSNQEPRA